MFGISCRGATYAVRISARLNVSVEMPPCVTDCARRHSHAHSPQRIAPAAAEWLACEVRPCMVPSGCVHLYGCPKALQAPKFRRRRHLRARWCWVLTFERFFGREDGDKTRALASKKMRNTQAVVSRCLAPLQSQQTLRYGDSRLRLYLRDFLAVRRWLNTSSAGSKDAQHSGRRNQVPSTSSIAADAEIWRFPITTVP